jgi:hypothetical protein
MDKESDNPGDRLLKAPTRRDKGYRASTACVYFPEQFGSGTRTVTCVPIMISDFDYVIASLNKVHGDD